MSDLVGNQEEGFSRVTAYIFLFLGSLHSLECSQRQTRVSEAGGFCILC